MMSGDNGEAKLTARQERGLVALLSSPSIVTAAQASGIAVQSLKRWLAEPGFQAAYRQARRQAVENAIAGLQGLAADAVEALRTALANPNKNISLRAARIILDYSVRGVELVDLEERLAALE